MKKQTSQEATALNLVVYNFSMFHCAASVSPVFFRVVLNPLISAVSVANSTYAEDDPLLKVMFSLL